MSGGAGDLGDLIDAAIALGLGLLVGLEREHREVEYVAEGKAAPGETPLGVRTLALLSILGWLSGRLGDVAPWLLPVALLAVAGLLAAAYLSATDRGLTTEIAALVVFLTGAVVHRSRELAVAIALTTTILLVSKPWFLRTVPKLRRMDFTATLQLLLILAILLPLLPTEARDPWGVLSPRRIGLFVTLILGISYVGYVLTRVLGARRGAGLTGFVGGLASSTAVTAAMAREAGREPAMIDAAQLAVFLANAVMPVRVLVVTAVISPRAALAVAPPLVALAVVMLAAAAWRWRAGRAAPDPAPAEIKNPMAILPALRWGAFLSAVLVIAAVAHEALGDRGLIVAGAISGFADVDAIVLAVSRSVADGTLVVPVARLALVVAVASNTVVKAGIALTGGRRFGAPVAAVFAVGLILAGGIALAMYL